VANVWRTKKYVDFTGLVYKLQALGEVTAQEREDKKKIYLYLNDKFVATMPSYYWEGTEKIMWDKAMDQENKDERMGI
jgi:hypothetical protein